MDTINSQYWSREIRNTDNSLLFRYETFINFLTFSFSTRGERDTIFTMLTVPTSPTVNLPAGLARPRVKSQLTAFFKNHQILSSSLPVMRSFTPQSHFLSGFFFKDICDCHILCARVNCTQCVCTCTNSRIVQSPTKLNDKI